MYYVVGDRGLNAGSGTFVPTLEAMRDSLIQQTRQHLWTLVISIHGAQTCVAAQGGSVASPTAPGTYNAEAITRVFNQHQPFVTWRAQNGPSHVVLNACQVNRVFEGVILSALLRPGSAQQAQGLGSGCRPSTYTEQLIYNNRTIANRRQWRRFVPARERPGLLSMLNQLNQESGYFGAPSVPAAQVLHYYFDEEPLGGWPVVTVSVQRQGTGHAFFNRSANPRILQQCTGHMRALPRRTTIVPPVTTTP